MTGAMNNCYCNTTWMAYPHSGGYMIFENFEFIRDNFHVVGPWAAASVIGGGTAVIVLIFAVTWWMKCQHLWSAKERRTGVYPLQPFIHANMDWLQ